jgi:hypothetical protein
LWQDALDQAKKEEGPVALRLGQRRGLPAQGGARQRHRPVGAQRPAGGHDQAAPSDRRPGPPGFTSGAGFGSGRARGNGRITWPHDGNYYQFWTDGSEDGKFTIANVRPGTYTLHAFADGVLGEFTNYNITVTAGKTLDLGKLEWKPVRYGKQVWEIGYPDRTGGKFYKGDGSNYWLWGWCVRYPLLVPERHHLHHWQERLPQGLVLRAGAARAIHRLAQSRR